MLNNFPHHFFGAYYHTQSPRVLYANLDLGGAKVTNMISPFNNLPGDLSEAFCFDVARQNICLTEN